MIKFSIITVCYNVKKHLERTVSSILNQKYTDFELIIVDGGSDDGTMELLLEWQKKQFIKIIHEPDRGLYDAMNKGIRRSEGDFIIFMNAGDEFDSPDVLGEIVPKLEKNKNVIYYGTSKAVYPNGKIRSNRVIYRKNNNFLKDVFEGKMPNHQATFASRDCFENNMFDEEYPLCADFCWIARCAKKRGEIYRLNTCVAKFMVGGRSSRPSNRKRILEEKEKILLQVFPIRYRIFRFFEPR